MVLAMELSCEIAVAMTLGVSLRQEQMLIWTRCPERPQLLWERNVMPLLKEL